MGTEAESLTGAIAEHQSAISDMDLDVTGILNRMGGSYLPEGTNIDNLAKEHSGCWVYSRAETEGVFPIEDTYGTICHIQGTSENIAMQIIRSNAQGSSSTVVYMRFKMGGTWGAWQRFISSKTTDLAITRTANSYADSTTIGYLQARKKNGYLSFRGNLMLSGTLPTNTSDVEIGRISGWTGVSGILTVAPQNSSAGNLLVTVTSTGVIAIANYSGKSCSGAYRFVLTTPCMDGYE